QRAEPRSRLLDAEVEVALGGEGDVHRRKRNLDQIERSVTLEVPGAERMGDPRPEADRVPEAERRVVGEAGLLERTEIAVRVDAQEVVALALNRPGQRLESLLLAGDPLRVVCGRVAAMEPDLGAALPKRLDESGPQPLVVPGGRAVEVVRVLREQEERRRGAGPALVAKKPVEAPVRVRAADPVHRYAGEPAQLAQPRLEPASAQVGLRPRRGALHAPPRPLPRHVDVVCERDGEARAAPARRIDSQ